MSEDSKRKLLIIITKSNFGGAQRYVFDIARTLKNTYDVAVVCGGDGLLVEKLKEENIRTYNISYLDRDVHIGKDILSIFSLARILRKEKPDIIHLNSSKASGLGSVASLVYPRAKKIFTAHAWAFNENRGAISKAIIGGLHWITVMLSDKTIAVSAGVKKQIEHLPRMEGRIQVIHLGLDKPIFYGKNNARMVLGIPEKTFAIGTIAELHPVKGLEYALEAMKNLDFPFTYTIIGTGDLKEKLEDIVKNDSKLSQSVIFKGFIPDASTLIPAFDVFLLPSLSEAFGYVLLESGFAHIPVIATSVGGIPEIIEDMKSGILIHPRYPKEISQAIQFTYSNKKAIKQFGIELNQKIQTKFSVNKMVEETEAVYTSVLSNKLKD